MCAIFGLLGPGIDADLALRLRDRMAHRGPDDSGAWADEAARVWLGHRRLSILDLSPLGHQPMASAGGRYVIVFNGEIFNFVELRAELERAGATFRGHSDTEVILAAIECWGLERSLSRFVGMFAFALWDREDRALSLVRDRIGIKPLYYAYRGAQFAFASELSALRSLPWVDTTLDRAAIAQYLRHLCVPAPHSILQGICKVEPGQIVTFANDRCQTRRYWDLHDVVARGLDDPLKLGFEEASAEYERMLTDAIRMRMRSDVPVGSFLSGGIDSSLVTALMTKVSDRKVQTFTIGFPDEPNDESAHARAVAAHLRTDHHELFLDANTVPGLVADVSALHDEPFADGSSLPTFILSRFAREHVTVALGGDGGDETFGGYPRYFWAERIRAWQQRLGRSRAMWARGLKALPDWFWSGPVDALFGARLGGSAGLRARAHRLADYIAADPRDVDRIMHSAWPEPADVLEGDALPPVRRDEAWRGIGWAEQMMAIDQRHYLPDDILTKVDRMSMAVGLEARVPLLDHRLVEWSWRVPLNFKLAAKGDRGKLLMRDVLYRHVPRDLIERPKAGFGMPMDRWLRGPLREWAGDLVAEPSLRRIGLFRPQAVQRVWREHLGGANRLPQLWTVLMMQAWLMRSAPSSQAGH